MSKRTRGFTLIELMIVVAVVAILASVAISQYNKQVRKSRRAEAKQVITDMALRQEKWRSNHTTYVGTNSTAAEKAVIGVDTPATSSITKEYYTIALNGNASATTFTIRATPKAGTDQTKDVCTPYLQLESVSGVVTKTPATNSCWQ